MSLGMSAYVCRINVLIIRIIEPLASRCSKFRFRPLAQGSSEARIRMIAEAEGVQTDDGVSSFHAVVH